MGGLFNTVAVNLEEKRRGRRNETQKGQVLLRRNKIYPLRLYDTGKRMLRNITKMSLLFIDG
jgi:hypothetical protein